MAGRGRGRGRGGGGGFDRNNPLFSTIDQATVLPTDKSSQHSRPYPQLDQFPATLNVGPEFDELYEIRSQMVARFQSSPYFLKFDDVNARVFSSSSESTNSKELSSNFNWDHVPLELRPVNKRKLPGCKALEIMKQSRVAADDLSVLDTLEEKEKSDDVNVDDETKPPVTNKDNVEDETNEEVEEFDDEELDEGTDYLKDYFDGGEDYLDDDDDHDEGPCY